MMRISMEKLVKCVIEYDGIIRGINGMRCNGIYLYKNDCANNIIYCTYTYIYTHVYIYIYIDQSMIDMGGSRVDPQVAGHTSLSAV